MPAIPRGRLKISYWTEWEKLSLNTENLNLVIRSFITLICVHGGLTIYITGNVWHADSIRGSYLVSAQKKLNTDSQDFLPITREENEHLIKRWDNMCENCTKVKKYSFSEVRSSLNRGRNL